MLTAKIGAHTPGRFATQLMATWLGVRPHAPAAAPTVCAISELRSFQSRSTAFGRYESTPTTARCSSRPCSRDSFASASAPSVTLRWLYLPLSIPIDARERGEHARRVRGTEGGGLWRGGPETKTEEMRGVVGMNRRRESSGRGSDRTEEERAVVRDLIGQKKREQW